MREIKFRGKAKKGNEWIYGMPIQWCDGDWRICDTYTKYTVDGNTIGQYTGLKDKNGKEIYEGDIVEWDESVADGQWRTIRIKVQFQDGGFYPLTENLIDEDGNAFLTRVIGNIYDNKELLEEEK